MPTFAYKAFSEDGKSNAGLVEAPTQDQAVKLLKEKQLFVVSVSQSQGGSITQVFSKFQKVGFGDIVNSTRELATMIVAGLSLPNALSILRLQTTNKTLAAVLQNIEHAIVGGGNFADALLRYPQYFSATYVALVRAGEASGKLEIVLARLADSLESQREFRAKVIGALIYPAIIVVGMVVVVAVMMIVVVPKLMDLYRDFNVSLPATTRFLITVSNFTVNYWWLVMLLVVGTGIALSRWKKTRAGQYMIDRLLLKIPIFGDLQKKIILVEFTRTFSMLITSGIHILNALKILKNSVGNVVFRDAVENISKKVEKGFPLGDTFGTHHEFPIIVAQMMKVGEETGKLDDILNKLANYFQAETENLVKGLTTAIEPIIMVFLGVGVGFIVLSVITPIYNLTAQFK